MGRTSKILFLTALAAVGWVLLTLSVSGVSGLVMIKAPTIASAPTSGNTNLPLLNDLINCPFQATGNVLRAQIHVVLVDCSDANEVLIAPADCNAALAKVHTVNLTSGGHAPTISSLPYNSSASSPYTDGYYATYVGSLDLSLLTGAGFKVNLVKDATLMNSEAIGTVVQGARGLVFLTEPDSVFPVVVFPNDSTLETNPCSGGHDLDGINVTSEFTRSPGTVPYLVINQRNIPSNASLCNVDITHVFELGPEPGSFSENTTDSCALAKFSTNPAPDPMPNPRTYYPSDFVNLTDDNPSNPTTFLGSSTARPTNLNFYPSLRANETVASGIDLNSALTCLNSPSSSSSGFGSVSGFVVQCDNLYTGTTFYEHFSTCQTALHTVREKIGTDTNLLVSVQLSAVSDDVIPPPGYQAQYVSSAIYDTSVSGAVIQLRVDPTKTTSAAVSANFAGVAAIANAFSSIYGLSGTTDRFNLFFEFDESYCAAGGPLTPQGTGTSKASVYTNCNVAGVNCLFGTNYATARSTSAVQCGFPENSVVIWEVFRGVATAPNNHPATTVEISDARTSSSTRHGMMLTSRATVSAPDFGSGTYFAEVDLKACDDATITPVYNNLTIASSEAISGPTFGVGSVGALITPQSASSGANGICVFSSAGAGAEYGIVECDSSDSDFPKDCSDGFEALRAVSEDALLVGFFDIDANSDQINSLGATAGSLLNETKGAGAYLSMDFGTGSDSSTNLKTVTRFVEAIVGNLTLPTDFDLVVGIAIDNASVCMSGGALYSSDSATTLHAQLTGAISEGVSFVVLLGKTSPVTLTEVCGFETGRLGYALEVSRTFDKECAEVTLGYVLVTLSPDVAPGTRGGGGGGEGSLPSPYWAFFAIPGAAVLVCLASTGTVVVIHHRRNRDDSELATVNPYYNDDFA